MKKYGRTTVKLEQFLVKAKLSAYANKGERGEVILADGCKEITFQEGEFSAQVGISYHDEPRHQVAVSAQELRGGVHDVVRPEVEGPLQLRGHACLHAEPWPQVPSQPPAAQRINSG